VVDPGFGEAPLGLLQGSGSAEVLTQVILPQLLNELATSGDDLLLMLDDYHLISSSTCHHTLGFFIDHLPANAHVVLSTRTDPPLSLARLRARGELTELRIADLGFTDAEAARLLRDAMALDLTPQEVQRLRERTEGWAAGLVLAGLSMRGRTNPESFTASFEAGHRHVVDYLGSEVLARQPEPLRTFMVRISILQRLSAPLCDAVLETDNSAAVLAELEQANQFLIALDDHRTWYRYHHLFGQLLALELADREPELAPMLHRRAAAWNQDAGDSVVNIKNKSHAVTAEVVVPDSGAEGVIIAQGGSIGGWSLYAKDGKPRYCYNLLGVQRFYVACDQAIPAGQHQVRMEFAYDGGGLGKGGNVLLFVDGERVGEGRVGATAAMVFSADDTCDVGVEGGAVVSEDYGPRGNEFSGEVNWVQIDLDAVAEDLDHLITPEERLQIAMARQ
jgi:hypothetical protein